MLQNTLNSPQKGYAFINRQVPQVLNMVHLGPLANAEALAEDGPDMDNADEFLKISKQELLKVT